MKLFGPYKKRSRSASMQLSINAIVILVMAMAVLGLGLGLIRGVLGQGKAKLTKAVAGMDISEQATSEKPIANADTISIKPGKSTPVAVSFYNTGYDCSGDSNAAELVLSCKYNGTTYDSNTAGTDNGFWLEGNVLSVDAPQGEATKLAGIFKVKGVPATTYPCKVKVKCGTKYPAAYSTFIKVSS